MQTKNEGEQVSLFGQDSDAGRMCLEPSPARREKTFGLSSRRLSGSRSHRLILLDLRPGAGNLLGPYWEYDPPWLGPPGTLNTSESPNGGVFLVADFAGYSPIQILFEQGRLSGDTAESGAERKSPAASAEGGPGTPGGGIFAFHINQREETIDLGGVAGALMATTNMQMQTFVASGVYSETGSTADGKGPGVLCLNDQGGERMGCTYDQTATLRSQTRGHEPLVFENHTLDSRCTGPHKAAPTISAAYGTGSNNTSLVVEDRVYARQRADCFREDEVASTQSARQHKDTTDLVLHPTDPPRLIRRLTPLECERLQGFPDGWTEIPGASDSARYRALGNSVAIPCVEYLFRGVAYFLGREAPFR